MSQRAEPDRRELERRDWVLQFGNRVRFLRTQAGITQGDLADLIGAGSLDVITRLERGIAKTVALTHLSGLLTWAQQAGSSPQWLLTGTRPVDAASRSELVEALANVMVAQRFADGGLRVKDAAAPHTSRPQGIPGNTVHERIVTQAETAQQYSVVRKLAPGFKLADPADLPRDWRTKYLPVIGRLAAGQGIDTVEAEQRPPGWADRFVMFEGAPPRGFGLAVTGHSMSPQYADGDMVVIDPDQPVEAGVACVVYDADGERQARLKVLHLHGSGAILESLNDQYAEVTIPRDALIAAYSVIAHLPRLAEE